MILSEESYPIQVTQSLQRNLNRGRQDNSKCSGIAESQKQTWKFHTNQLQEGIHKFEIMAESSDKNSGYVCNVKQKQ